MNPTPTDVLKHPTEILKATPVDHGLRHLSRWANKGRLWLGIAAVGALLPGRTRRAAIRGAGALAATSFIVNVFLKPAARRKRPLLHRTPIVRQLTHAPRTHSFPSGHAASAAAFATGAALEYRKSAWALVPLAAAVGYSRVHVGVHYASDVVAGAAVGAGVALATRRWWPIITIQAAQREPAAAPALPEGKGLVLLANPEAGIGDGWQELRERLPQADLVKLEPGVDVADVLQAWVATARAIGVAGGDGTVSAVAAVAVRHGLPVAVFPTGTLNHFARDAGIWSIEDTVIAVETGQAHAVDVATVNGLPFLNTAVVGAYPDLVHDRDQLVPRYGKRLATAVAAWRVLPGHTPLRLGIGGRQVKVWTLFVGNCRYDSHVALPATRGRLNDGLLDVSYLRADTPFSRTRAVLAALARVRERPLAHPRKAVTALRVVSPDGPVEFARDGEAGERASVLRFGKLPDRLVVYTVA
jgi:diacylglycerol kinase family enzyme/membrane-associated phospholipid phosphatase